MSAQSEDERVYPRTHSKIGRWVGRTILRLMGWRLRGVLPSEPKAIIIGGPHTSNWDLFLAMGSMLATGLKFSWMMKKEAFFWPLGPLWKSMGGIPIDRKTAKNVTQQMADWFNSIETGYLGMTPEGTRSKVESYKKGYLRIAKASGVPLFLVGIQAETKEVWLDRLWWPNEYVEGEKLEAENTAIRDYIESHYRGIRKLKG